MIQTTKCIVKMTKEETIKILNFMNPWEEVQVQGRGQFK